MGEITARCGEMSGGQIPGLLAPGGPGLSHEEGARCSTGPWGGSALPCPAPVPGSPQPRGHPQLVGLGWEALSGFSIPRGGRTPAPSWQMFIPSGPEPPLMVCQCLLRHRRARCQKRFSHA